VKTIETHLARIFRKLEVSKRAELARIVGGAGDRGGSPPR
jgi:DNA-binding NarL/FixJ family response regulator